MKTELQELNELKLTTRQKIRTLLVKTGREGMGDLLNYMEEIGFFVMPAHNTMVHMREHWQNIALTSWILRKSGV